MKIGFFIDTFYPMVDGVILVVDNYARRLSKKHEVIVFAPRINGKDFDDTKLPYKVVRCSSFNLNFLDYCCPTPHLDKEFKKILEKSNLDICHIHSPFMVGKTGVKYAKKHKIPVVSTLHTQFNLDFERATGNPFLTKMLLKSVGKVFRSCDECYTMNSKIQQSFSKEYKLKKLPKIIRNATEMSPLNIQERKKAKEYIKKKYNIKENENIFLFVGRIDLVKNLYFIIDSLKELKNKNIPFKMIFVGSGHDEERLKKYIKNKGLNKDIIFAGRITDRDELKKYYASAKLFLFPSLFDTSSLVQIEAATQNLPSLFLKNSATSGTVTNNVNGFESDNNYKAYAKRIIEILNNKELYDKVANNSFRDLYYTWDDITKIVLDEYERLIELKRK